MRSHRLLRGMHKVFSHDLPNQMVALQSLLQLLNNEEAERLGPEGHEYVRRLLNATQRAREQVRFLKEMGHVNSCTVKAETISLSLLGRELQGELQQKHPGRQFAFEWQWDVPAVVGDVRTFLLALSELCAGFLQTPWLRCLVAAHSAQKDDATEITFRLETPRPAIPRWTSHNLDAQMEIILAREWLALSDAELSVSLPSDGSVRFPS